MPPRNMPPSLEDHIVATGQVAIRYRSDGSAETIPVYKISDGGYVFGDGRPVVDGQLEGLHRAEAFASRGPAASPAEIAAIKRAARAAYVRARAEALESATDVEKSPPPSPRQGRLILAWFLNRDQLEATMGDLEEHFAEDVASHGLIQAKWLYWSQVFRSAFDSAWPKLEKMLDLAGLLKKLTSGPNAA